MCERMGTEMTLGESEIGKCYRILKIELDERVTRRLEMLGMTRNTEIQVMNKKKAGPVILKVRGTRFALGRNFARGIMLGGAEDGQ